MNDVYKFLSQNPKVDWIYGKINVVEEDGSSVGVFPKWKIFQLSSSYLLKFVNFIPHQAVIMKKDVFDKFGDFDTRLKTGMDYDLWLRLAKNTKWSFCDRLISNYMIRKDSNSSSLKNKSRVLKDFEAVQKRYLNKPERIFAKIVNRIVARVNRTYR